MITYISNIYSFLDFLTNPAWHIRFKNKIEQIVPWVCVKVNKEMQRYFSLSVYTVTIRFHLKNENTKKYFLIVLDFSKCDCYLIISQKKSKFIFLELKTWWKNALVSIWNMFKLFTSFFRSNCFFILIPLIRVV